MKFAILGLTALCAACTTPGELNQPPGAPSLAEPVSPPPLPPYVAPIPHAAPRSDRAGTR